MSKDSNIGCRVISNGNAGTICWYGIVEGIAGEWYGVDWDDESRGKHNGACSGIQYFSTRNPTSGSFVRPNKISFGLSLEEALKQRYQSEIHIDNDATKELQRSIKARFVEIVGMDKVGKQQSELKYLKVAVLDHWPVYGAESTDLNSIVPSLVELDLSATLIPSWDEVADIAKQLPKLQSLNISGNLLKLPENPKSLITSFEHIQQLVMNHMIHYGWNEILFCLSMFPKIKKLQLSHNKLTKLSQIPENHLTQLEELDLGVNSLSDWEEVCYLGHLKSLRTLNLNNCKFEHIFFQDIKPGNKTDLFSNLEALMIANNPLNEWESVAELNKLKNLTQLIIPLNGQQTYVIEFTFARIYNLKMLNRTEITLMQKRDYQSFYMRSYSNDYYNCGGTEDDATNLTESFLKIHPTYPQLVKDLGAPTDERNCEPQKSQKIRDLKLELTISVLGRDDLTDKTKSFMPNTRISKVKMIIRRLYNFSPNVDMKLFYSYVKDDEYFEFEFENLYYDLQYYSVSNGDTIIVRLQ